MLGLIECGPAEEEGQSPQTPALFYRPAFDAGEATISRRAFLKREAHNGAFRSDSKGAYRSCSTPCKTSAKTHKGNLCRLDSMKAATRPTSF